MDDNFSATSGAGIAVVLAIGGGVINTIVDKIGFSHAALYKYLTNQQRLSTATAIAGAQSGLVRVQSLG